MVAPVAARLVRIPARAVWRVSGALPQLGRTGHADKLTMTVRTTGAVLAFNAGRYDDAVRLAFTDGTRSEALRNRGALRLARGDYRGGCSDMAAAIVLYAGHGPDFQRRWVARTAWSGTESLDAATLVVHGVQGLGDHVLWARFLWTLRARWPRARVVFITHRSLAPLFAAQRTPGGAPLVDAVWAAGDPQTAAHEAAERAHGRPFFHVLTDALGDAVGAMTAADLVPALPYLVAPAHPVADAVRALPGLRVGVTWASGPGHLYADKSLPLAVLAPLAAVPGVSLVALQAGAHADDPCDFPLWRPAAHGHPLADFTVTAAAATACDLVVSVDTSVANLAGALACPVWVLVPAVYECWRWAPAPGAPGASTPWYPTARTFRQSTPGAWGDVVASVADALRARSYTGTRGRGIA